ncbi:MAG: hypothetical protein RMK29_18270 [Myxococcales bacterium]|nr:hypothetical protein [Myxococcales bacterium]
MRQKSQVCSDGKGHYIVVTPDEPEAGRYTTLYYGDGKRFFEVPGYAGLTRTLFRDPRFFNSRVSPPDRSWGRREVDRRLLSGVALEEGKCSLWCGERDKAFALLEPAKAQTLLKGAVFLPTPRQFQPHALSRDDEGTYYYVDRGYFADTSKNFRLFIGKKGALKPQAITDVISDSGGDVITTKAGTLSIGRGTVQWKSGGKATPLIPLPLADDTDEGPRNLMLVYGELGVYRGERLGTPCDDL